MQKEKAVLIVGGSGFVGQALCETLTAENIRAINFSTSLPKTTVYESICGDVTDKRQLETIFKNNSIFCVVNLASLLQSASTKDPLRASRVGIGGTLNLMELCREYAVNRFIYGGSTSLLRPNSEHQKSVDEKAPIYTSSIYDEIKRFAEEMGKRASKVYGFDFVSARISLVVGPGRPSNTSAYRTEIFNKLVSGGEVHIPFSKDEVLPLNHFQDVANAIELLINARHLQHSIYHLPCESWRVSDLADKLCEINQNLSVTFGGLKFSGGAPFVDWGRMRVELGASIVPLDQRLLEYKNLLLKRRKDAN